MAQKLKITENSKLSEFIEVVSDVFQRARLPQHSAMMAYYTLLSLFPLLLVLANIIPLLPIDTAELLDVAASILPENISSIVEPILINYLESGSGGAITIGVITSLWSASALVVNLRFILNEIYGTTDIAKNFIVGRILAPLIFLGIIGAVTILLFLFIFGETLIQIIEGILNVDFMIIETLFSFRTPILIVVLLIVFSLVYQLIPDIKTPYKFAFPGAVVSTIGMLLLSELFTFYVNYSNNDALSNAAIGSFVALMLYLYFVYLIILAGAVVNAVVFELATDESVLEATIDKGNKDEEDVERLVLNRSLTKVYPMAKEKRLIDEERER